MLVWNLIYVSLSSALLKMKANVGAFHKNRKRPLHTAARTLSSASFNEVLQLLKNRADPNERADDGLTPVHVAAIYGNYEVLKLLLLFGGDPWLKVNGCDAIDFCEKYDQRDCTSLLLNWSEEEKKLLYSSEKMEMNDNNSTTRNYLTRLISCCCCRRNSEVRLPPTSRDAGAASGPHDYVSDDYDSKSNNSSSLNLEKKLTLRYPSLASLAISVASEAEGNDENNLEFDSQFMSSVNAKVSRLNHAQLRSELVGFGCDVGPINTATEKLYRQRLKCILLDSNQATGSATKASKYSKELHSCIGETWSLDSAKADENLFLAWVQDPHRSWRGGSVPSCFVYLLLDPSLAPLDRDSLKLNQFVEVIFYVGKGTGLRPLQHFLDVFNPSGVLEAKNAKEHRIVQSWRKGKGVLLLLFSQLIISVEAHTKEAAVIDTIGLENLTNLKRGTYYGSACEWTMSRQRRFGALLIMKAFKLYQLTGATYIKAGHLN